MLRVKSRELADNGKKQAHRRVDKAIGLHDHNWLTSPRRSRPACPHVEPIFSRLIYLEHLVRPNPTLESHILTRMNEI